MIYLFVLFSHVLWKCHHLILEYYSRMVIPNFGIEFILAEQYFPTHKGIFFLEVGRQIVVVQEEKNLAENESGRLFHFFSFFLCFSFFLFSLSLSLYSLSLFPLSIHHLSFFHTFLFFSIFPTSSFSFLFSFFSYFLPFSFSITSASTLFPFAPSLFYSSLHLVLFLSIFLLFLYSFLFCFSFFYLIFLLSLSTLFNSSPLLSLSLLFLYFSIFDLICSSLYPLLISLFFFPFHFSFSFFSQPPFSSTFLLFSLFHIYFHMFF